MWKLGKTPKKLIDATEISDKYVYRDNVFHVSELSYTCMYKIFYDRIEGKEFNKSGLWNIYRGIVFDRAITPLFDENELRVQMRVPNTDIIIRGKIDAVDYDENVIYEFKTVVSIKFVRKPYQHHTQQALFYLCNYDPNAVLKLVYVSMDGHKTFEFVGGRQNADAHMPDFVKKAKSLRKALRNKEAPEPQRASECNWCRYKEEGRCPIVKTRKRKK